MSLFTDPFLGRVIVTLLFGTVATLLFFGVDIFLLLTRRRFGFVNINIARFTRRDWGSTDDKLFYRTIDSNAPLTHILHNRYLFWYIVWCSLKASFDEPVLEFDSHEYRILSLFRGRVVGKLAGMEMKRYGGMSFVSTPSMLCIVYDHSEDKNDRRSRILRVMIIPKDVLDNFESYRRKPPQNTKNWELMKKIHEAYETKTGSFIDIEITTA